MISSMTAFSRGTQEDKWGSIVWELRSVNHRYLDMAVRLPESLRHLEKAVRDQIQQHLYRGKVEALLKFNPGEAVPFDFVVNEGLLDKLASAGRLVEKKISSVRTSLTDILLWQGVLDIKDTHMDQVSGAVLSVLQSTLEDMVDMRRREGGRLKSFIEERLEDMKSEIDMVKGRMPEMLKSERARILSRFEEFKLELDKERLEQEMLWLIQKSDIAEELQRLDSHLVEVKAVLEKGGVMGRKLDFMMQELNREANTIASKSIDAEVSKAAIEMKVKIEQMREQVQNIE